MARRHAREQHRIGHVVRRRRHRGAGPGRAGERERDLGLVRLSVRKRNRLRQPRAIPLGVVRRIEPDAPRGARGAHEPGAALRVRHGGEVDGEVRARPAPGERAEERLHPLGRHDAHAVHPGLAEHGRGVLGSDDERDVGAGIAVPQGTDGGNVEEEIAQLILRAVELDAPGLRLGHSLPVARLSFSSSSTFTRRSWQSADIWGVSKWR